MHILEKEIYYHTSGPSFSPDQFSKQLAGLYKTYRDHPFPDISPCDSSLSKKPKNGHCPIRFLCIGSDRVTGDSLGPLIGYKLRKYLPEQTVIGTLSRPVHALNLSAVISALQYDPSFIVAIDASLGEPEHIGCITVSNGSIRPGLGVSKKLPHVGQASITGIVGSIYSPEDSVLQNTRLSLVMQLADAITLGILRFYYRGTLQLPL